MIKYTFIKYIVRELTFLSESLEWYLMPFESCWLDIFPTSLGTCCKEYFHIGNIFFVSLILCF